MAQDPPHALGLPPFYRIAEFHFPSMQALEACAASDDGKEALAHAVKKLTAEVTGEVEA